MNYQHYISGNSMKDVTDKLAHAVEVDMKAKDIANAAFKSMNRDMFEGINQSDSSDGSLDYILKRTYKRFPPGASDDIVMFGKALLISQEAYSKHVVSNGFTFKLKIHLFFDFFKGKRKGHLQNIEMKDQAFRNFLVYEVLSKMKEDLLAKYEIEEKK